jgi:Transposase DDE domain
MALSLQAVFRLALRQTEGLIGSVIGLLDLDLAIPAHTTLCRRADSLDVPCPRFDPAAGGMHLIVDSTGLKFHGPGEWLVEKHATQTRRSWRKPHMGMDADSGQIVAAELTTNDVDDASQVEPLLEQIIGPLASFTADGAYDTEDVSTAVAQRHPDAAVIVPPRTNAAESEIDRPDQSDAAVPSSEVYRRARPHRPAEGVRLQSKIACRVRDRPLQTSHRRRGALSDR